MGTQAQPGLPSCALRLVDEVPESVVLRVAAAIEQTDVPPSADRMRADRRERGAVCVPGGCWAVPDGLVYG